MPATPKMLDIEGGGVIFYCIVFYNYLKGIRSAGLRPRLVHKQNQKAKQKALKDGLDKASEKGCSHRKNDKIRNPCNKKGDCVVY